jgi:hypothetical protein
LLTPPQENLAQKTDAASICLLEEMLNIATQQMCRLHIASRSINAKESEEETFVSRRENPRDCATLTLEKSATAIQRFDQLHRAKSKFNVFIDQ